MTKEEASLAKIEEPSVKDLVIEELKKIEGTKGIIAPQDLVDVARSEKSPIHNLFDWNDRSAGEKYRIWQARYIIKSVRVQIEDVKTDAFYNAVVNINNVPVRGYLSAEKAFSDSEVKSQLIRSALNEIKYWQNKYKSINELSTVVNGDVIEELETEIPLT